MRLVTRPIDATHRLARRMAAKLSPARWLWPEEDAHDAGDAIALHRGENAQEPS